MIREQILARGIGDERVLAAMRTVPRERFVPAEQQASAYDDGALAIAHHQTISQPFIVAYMTNALHIAPHHKVLEIGTGSGYQTAILAHLTEHLHTVERIEALATAARDRLTALGITHPHLHIGDGSLGWPEDAPYDRMIVTAAAPTVPATLIDQLADDGQLIIPVGEPDHQRLVSVWKRPARTIERPSSLAVSLSSWANTPGPGSCLACFIPTEPRP